MCDTGIGSGFSWARCQGSGGDVKLDKMMGQVPRTWNTMLRD